MKRKSKLYSSTLYFTIWSATLLTINTIFKLSLDNTVAALLVGIVVTYVAGEKTINYKHGPEGREDK